jgi:hypothetical protein
MNPLRRLRRLLCRLIRRLLGGFLLEPTVTIPASDRRKEYAGNGTTTVFTGPRAFSASHITVFLVDDESGDATAVSTDDYTLSGVNANGATTITMDTAPAEGETLLILRTVPYTQETDITNQGAFLPEVMEDAFDALEQQIQQLEDLYNRTLHLGDTTIINNLDLELPAPEAYHALRWNATETALENYLPDVGEWPFLELTAGRALTADDAFKVLVYGDYGEATFYLPANVFAAGDEFILVNDSTSDLTLVPNNSGGTAAVTFYNAGSGRTWVQSASGVLAAHSVARIYMTSTSRGYIVAQQPSLYVHESAVVNKDLQVTERTTNGVAVLTSAAGVLDIDLSLANYFTVSLTEDITSITFSNLPASPLAQTVWIRIFQNASAAKTVAWPASFKWEGGVAPSVSTTLSAYDVLALTSVDQGTRWEATLAKGWA